MDNHLEEIARGCLQGAESGTMTFPEIVGRLLDGGFEGYAVDFRRASATYYLLNGDSTVLPTHLSETLIAESFDTAAIQCAIREAQQQVLGYTYAGFCRKVMAAGCAGYQVSFTGRRAVYFGRTAELYTEHFPQ
jgi:uncharacterized protein YbcV (DUF1398 family)